MVEARPFRWGWRERLRAFRYNWVIRPWRNLRRGYPKEATLSRDDYEWAHRSIIELANDPEFIAVGEEIKARKTSTTTGGG